MSHFLHTADWQVGRAYRFEPDDAAALAVIRINSVKHLAGFNLLTFITDRVGLSNFACAPNSASCVL